MSPFWEENLKALGRRPEPLVQALVRALGDAGPGPDLGLRNRTGAPLPGLIVGSGARALVSTFDPAKEADRWGNGVTGGTVAVFGGAGVAAAGALVRAGVILA
ncbi:MAG TPA: hypothetical protein VMB23_08765, partial [Spirochaetia bacterium]|nr:hypothetical protein [Spirochaetia bacterium]